MRVASSDTKQKRLYIHNRTVPDAQGYAEMLDIERDWVVRMADEAEAQAPAFTSPRDLVSTLHDLLADEERAYPSEPERFIAEEATLDQFRSIVGDFAVDGLVESQSHLGIIARLPAKARTTVFRVLIDEFGCGNNDLEHAQLYVKLMTELGMSTRLEDHVATAPDETFAYVNIFHWYADRAPAPEYFLGAYSYFESSVLYAFKCYAEASKRLGIVNDRYFTEHLYIDQFHSGMMQSAIHALDQDRPADLAKVWAGVLVTQQVVAAATSAAVTRAVG